MNEKDKHNVFFEVLGKYKDTQNDISGERNKLLTKLKSKSKKLQKTKQDLQNYKHSKLKILLGLEHKEDTT